MANKTIPALPDYGSQDSDKIRKDLLEITKNDGTYASPSYPTGATRKITVEDLKTALAITSQTVTNGVTTNSPSEDAVFDAIYAKGLVKSNAWKNNGVGTFTLEADKYNIVNYSNTNIEILLPAVEVDKTIIVQGTTQDGSGAVNFTINNIKIGGADLGTPYSVTVTNEKEVLIFYGNYYGWHLIGHSNKTIDLSTKLDLDGGNANQDIDIDGFGLNAKHFKVNGTAGAGHIGLKHQSASITASASESSIGADSVGDPVWKNDGGAIDKLELQSNKTDTVTGNEASTSKYLTVKGVYDWAVGLFAPKASPTFTGTVTTPDIVVSGATATTIAHFDATKNIKSLSLATYPSLTELSYVKGVTSAIQTQINTSNNQIAYESWTTDDNYTTQNTTAKRLIILHSGPLSTSRSLILTSPSVSQEVIVVAGATVSATNKIVVVPAYKINGTSFNSIDIVLPHSQTWLTYVGNAAGGFPGGTWSTSQASPQFIETATALTASKTLRGGAIGGGSSSSYTAPFTSPVRGDLKWHVSGGLMAYDGSLNEILAPYDPSTGWMDYRPSGRNIKYWNQLDISSGNKPIEYSTNFGFAYYWGQTYKVILRGEATDEYCEYTVFVDGSGVPSIQKTHKSSATLTMAIVSGGLRVTGSGCYAYIYKQGRLTALENPDLNQSFSNDGLSNYWSGSIGIGHTSQNASAVLQADSTTKGFLPPRMTNTQRTNIVSPAVGLMVYCTDTIEGLYIYKSTGWTFII